MASTASELQAITRILNGIETAAQVRMACGEAAKAAGAAYPLLDEIPEGNANTATSLRGQLDSARLALDKFYRSITPRGNESYRNTWLTKGMPLVQRVYVVIAGIEGAAAYVPSTSNWEILFDAVADAPKLVGQAVGATAAAVGSAAGSAAGGILGGLGISGIVSVALVAGVVLLVVTKGSIIGRVGALASKAGG